MSYGVVINYGSGDVNLRSYSGEDLVLQKGFSKTEDLYNKDFKPTINTAKFSILLNSTLSAALFGLDNDDLITVTITKDGSGWFKGYIRPVTGVTVNAGGGDTIDFECVDVGWILKERPTSYAQKSSADSMTVFDGTSTANSIVHWVLTEAGFTGTVSGDDIAESIDYMRLYSTDYFETLSELLFAHHYTFYFDGDGNFHTYNWGPSSVSPAGTLDEDDMSKRLKVSRKDDDTNKVLVKYYDLNYTEDAVLSSWTDSDGGFIFDSNGDSLSLSLEAAPDKERQEWFADVKYRWFFRHHYNTNGKWVTIDDWRSSGSSHWSDALTLVDSALSVSASYSGTIYSFTLTAVGVGGGRKYTAAHVQVLGDIANVSEAGEKSAGSGGNEKKYDSKYCYSGTWAAELAQAILKNKQLSTWSYKWESQSDLSLGAYYTLDNSAANVSSSIRITKKTSVDKSNNDWYSYEAVGVSAIGTVIDATASGAVPAPLTNAQIAAAVAAATSELVSGGGETQEIIGPSLPATADVDPAGTGLYMFSDRFGYYDGTAEEWKAYIANDGKFKFSGTGSNAIEFDGTDLTVNADVALNGTVTTGDAIQSDNFNAGVAGWQIDGAGDAEFNSLTIRDEVFEAVVTSYSSGVTIGFDGTGTLTSPDETDRRVLIDNDQISMQEYTNGAWTDVNSIRIGGADSNGFFYPFLACRGVVNPLANEESTEYLPSNIFRVFNFENNYVDQYGVDDWATKSNVGFDGSAMFGSYSLGATSDEGYVVMEANWEVGDKFTIGAWVNVEQLDTVYGHEFFGFYTNTSGADDYIIFAHDGTNLEIRVRLNGAPVPDLALTSVSFSTGWHFMAITCDPSSDYARWVVDANSGGLDLGSTWGTPGTPMFKFFTYESATYSRYQQIDEAIISVGDYLTHDTLIQHYNHSTAWSTTASALDVVIKPAPGGRVVTDYPAGYIYGLETEADTDSDHDVKINPGKCRSYSDLYNLDLRAAITKRIDATWAAGDDAGGLFSGTVAADTTYHLFLIRKDSDGSIDAGWDTDIDCANIPTGYTAYRRIASFVTDGSSNIIYTRQTGNRFECVGRTVKSSGYSTTPSLFVTGVPSGLNLIAHLNIHCTSSSGDAEFKIHSYDSSYVGFSGFWAVAGGSRGVGPCDAVTNTSGQCRVSFGGALSAGYISIVGWTDDRGQYGGK